MDFLLDDAMNVAVEAARSAGQILRDMLETAGVREKAPKDLVTDADIAAQKSIEAHVFKAFPKHHFLGEESGIAYGSASTIDDKQWQWVVDPLDGTANYVHRLPNFAVSIALVRDKQVYLGVVYDPMANELYRATLGGGAFMNDQPIRASSCTTLYEAMIAASFPPQVERGSVSVKQFIEVLVRSQSVRRLGSAALNLCYVAQGRLDGYWASSLKPWDIAAGALILCESGANICRHNETAFDLWHGELVAASTPELMKEILHCLNHFED